ncbi:MAG TPA: hypothetical protein VKB38_07200 [Terracidiphilus sp.]|nr:hypothetical protein [Terracidiphilus sp.]
MNLRVISYLCLAIPAAFSHRAICQTAAPEYAETASTLLADADSEAKRGVYLFYSQNYVDAKKEKVDIHGSVYGVLRDVRLTGCDLEATIQVFDLFSGFVKELPTGEQQDLTEYSIRIHLTPDLAVTLIQARPAQLAHTMHTQCNDDPSCTFNWLKIQSAKPDIHERIVMNHTLSFDGSVQQVLAPVSSLEAGKLLMRDLQSLARARCR